MAEAIFNDRVRKAGLANRILGDSCGTAHYHIGDLPDHRTRTVLASRSVMVQHLGRQLKASDLDEFDLILAMDRQNLRDILSLSSATNNKKVKLMRDFDPKGNGDVPDPYYGTLRDFEEVFDMLDRCMPSLLESVAKRG